MGRRGLFIFCRILNIRNGVDRDGERELLDLLLSQDDSLQIGQAVCDEMRNKGVLLQGLHVGDAAQYQNSVDVALDSCYNIRVHPVSNDHGILGRDPEILERVSHDEWIGLTDGIRFPSGNDFDRRNYFRL